MLFLVSAGLRLHQSVPWTWWCSTWSMVVIRWTISSREPIYLRIWQELGFGCWWKCSLCLQIVVGFCYNKQIWAALVGWSEREAATCLQPSLEGESKAGLVCSSLVDAPAIDLFTPAAPTPRDPKLTSEKPGKKGKISNRSEWWSENQSENLSLV